MKTWLLILLGGVSFCMIVTVAAANPIVSTWGLHWAGAHNPQANTCDFHVTDCATTPRGEIIVNAPATAGRYDVYVLILQSGGVKTTSFGICCEGSIDILGWTNCADFESPSAGWPGCGEGDSLSWTANQHGNVTLGILDVEVYGSPASLCVCPDPRLGFAEMCHGSGSNLYCDQHTAALFFGCLGFDMEGYNPCEPVPVDLSTWGLMKALYK
jgi:hypothetical protein